MRAKRMCVAHVLLLACSSLAFPQQSRPRVAVVPLNPISVSKADATAFTGLMETGLVKTGSFEVLEQNQISAILEAQERSVSDCTDEKCAVEFGKLLAAEQIVLGSISAVGGKYVLNAKLIDVTSGKNLRADTVEADSLADLTGQTELLAFKLAGLTYRSGGEEQVAKSFAELFVETDPEGAEVLLNGLPKGKAPILLERVPVGKVTIEARKDTLYATADVDVTAGGLAKVSLKLEVSQGNVFIKSSVREGIQVVLDGGKPVPLGSGLFEKLLAGEHTVVLQGNGYYWEGRVTVETGKSVSLEAYPRGVGTLEYDIPEGVQAELSAPDVREVLRGSGRVEGLYAQSYSVHLTGTDYEPEELTVTLGRGEVGRLAPRPKRTEAYRKRAAYDALAKAVGDVEAVASAGARLSPDDAARAQSVVDQVGKASWSFPDLAERANKASATIADGLSKQQRSDAEAEFGREADRLEGIATGTRSVTAQDVAEARALQQGLSASPYGFQDLVTEAQRLVTSLDHREKVDQLALRRDDLERRIAATRRTRRGLQIAGGVSVGIGVAGAATAVISAVLGKKAYSTYQAATSAAEIASAWATVNTLAVLLNVGTGAGGGGAGLGVGLILARPGTAGLEKELAAAKAQLAELEEAGR